MYLFILLSIFTITLSVKYRVTSIFNSFSSVLVSFLIPYLIYSIIGIPLFYNTSDFEYYSKYFLKLLIPGVYFLGFMFFF